MLAPSKTAYCMVARVGRSALHSASTHHGLGTRCRFHAFCGHVSIMLSNSVETARELRCASLPAFKEKNYMKTTKKTKK